FTLYSGTTARQLLPQILKDVQSTDLQEMQQAISLAQAPTTNSPQLYPPGDLISNTTHPPNTPTLYLLIGLPDRCHRHRPDWVKVAVNGRCVQLLEIEQVILASFRRTLPRDRHPICFVHLHVPASQIDWNRHPAKTEVYLHHLTDWQHWVSQAIDQCLSTHLGTQNQRVTNLLTATESKAGYRVSRQIAAPDSDSLLHPSANPQPTPLRALAQVHNTYILAEHATGLWLVEQHIAHERVLYEQLCDRWQLTVLPTPIILNHLTPAQVDQLRRLELEVEAFGDQLWAVRTAPAMLAARSDCPEALMELSLGGDLESALVATACRSAIRNGTPLTLADMQTLLDQWQQTRNPRTCPHGRPIYLALEETALSRFFRRHWVIGKSHGI
ncbi:MAG: DNA mismatch repair endonuclease MutL, partial [Cyanobacteria bacterium]|nr:DNA mismatch repair endonuclease MutL [Cyanobacteriota bacterium]MDW8201755.1 DNA mismatch repair endonuclease MutL [Cyanobacteriota bacterium SKYGB_h_bin112]